MFTLAGSTAEQTTRRIDRRSPGGYINPADEGLRPPSGLARLVTTVQLLASVQGHQVARVRTIAAKLREREPAVTVELVEGPATAEQLQRHKLQFGPAVVIDGRLEFVGIPRLSMLLNRVAVARKRAEANLPSTEPFKVDVAGKDSKVVTLLRHPAAATAPAGFQADPAPGKAKPAGAEPATK